MTKFDIESQGSRLISESRYQEAWNLLKPFADEGSIYSLLALGWMREINAVDVKDSFGASYYYERAALLGEPSGYLRLGRVLADAGELLPARAAFENGAEKNNLGSMFELGRMLRKGEGGAASDEEGLKWLERAAREGHIFAQRELVSIQAAHSKSLIKKMILFPKVVKIAIKAMIQGVRDIDSDKIA